jgi:hypothetical protein
VTLVAVPVGLSEGVIERVRRLRGPYGAPGRPDAPAVVSGYGWPALEAGGAMPRQDLQFFHLPQGVVAIVAIGVGGLALGSTGG